LRWRRRHLRHHRGAGVVSHGANPAAELEFDVIALDVNLGDECQAARTVRRPEFLEASGMPGKIQGLRRAGVHVNAVIGARHLDRYAHRLSLERRSERVFGLTECRPDG
jgi:hypothetical protein